MEPSKILPPPLFAKLSQSDNIACSKLKLTGCDVFKKFINRESAARTALLKSLPKNAVGVEIGVWKGEFSTLLLKVTTPKTLHLIDPWLVSGESDRTEEAWYGANQINQNGMDEIHDSVARRFSSEISTGQVVIHRTSSEIATQAMPDESVDYVYVDGDHSYEGVCADLAAAFRITKRGGMICCDDYLLGAWWKDGVVRAVHELLVSRPVVIHSKANSQIVLRKLATAQ